MNHYIQITTPTSERHRGYYDTSKYRLEVTNNQVIKINGFVRLDGLQFKLITTSGLTNDIVFAESMGAYDLYVSNSILTANLASGSFTDGICLHNANTGARLFAWNNLFLNINGTSANASTAGIYQDTGCQAQAYNNTFINCKTGIRQSTGQFTAKNNLFSSCPAAASGTYVVGTDYNATTNTSLGYTVTGGGNTHDRISQTFTFINASGGDYHLASGDGGAKDHGVTDPGSGLFSNDIDGQTRQAPWDIGADEYQ